MGLNTGEVKPFDREDSVEEVLSEQQLEDSESGDAPVVVKVKFGGFSKHFEDLGNQETAQDGLPGGESLQLPSFLVTEVQRSVKVANMMRKLANVSLNRTSSPLEHLPKCPILDIGRFEDASSSGESKDMRSSLAAVHLLVEQLKQGGLSLASSPTPPSSWQSLVKATDLMRSPAVHGRLSSGRRTSRPESPSMASDKVPENEEITDDDLIEESNSDENGIEEAESGDDEEYIPKKAGADIEWWKKKAQSKVIRSKGKGGGKGKKSNVGDQHSISKYFKPKDEVAEIENADNDDDEEVDEVQEVEDFEETAEVVDFGRSFVGKCPLCDKSFVDMEQLSTHASYCEDTS